MKRTILGAVLPLLMAIMAQAQNIAVRGTVLSETDDEPLVGASIFCEANKTSAVTDIDGKFEISVPGGALLKISYVGFNTTHVKASADMTIHLEENIESLDEVVVVGYQTVKKPILPAPYRSFPPNRLKRRQTQIQCVPFRGKVPGMTITGNGSPSGTGSVRIRGIGSFNASQDPLFEIDGVPTTSDTELTQHERYRKHAGAEGCRFCIDLWLSCRQRCYNHHHQKWQSIARQQINVSFSANLTAQFYSSQSTMKLLDTPGYATAMAQAAMNDGIDPAAYASSSALTSMLRRDIRVRICDIASNRYGLYGQRPV